MNGGARALEFSLPLSYCEDKAEQTFPSAKLVFVHMGKLTTFTFGEPQMASCSFTGQPSFCLNTVKTFKARRTTAFLTSLC